jgi:hypothetical protein
MICFMPRRRRFKLTVDLVFFLSLLVDDRIVPGMSIP